MPCTIHEINANSFKTLIGMHSMSFSKVRDSHNSLGVHKNTNKAQKYEICSRVLKPIRLSIVNAPPRRYAILSTRIDS